MFRSASRSDERYSSFQPGMVGSCGDATTCDAPNTVVVPSGLSRGHEEDEEYSLRLVFACLLRPGLLLLLLLFWWEEEEVEEAPTLKVFETISQSGSSSAAEDDARG